MQDASSNPRAFLVEERDNPSTAFFVEPALRAAGLDVQMYGHEDVPAPASLESVVVVFVRYVPAAWKRLIDRAKVEPSRIVLFMDDDVLDTRASSGMAREYRSKLARLAARRKRWLYKRSAELWVSTPYLQQKYAAWKPRLVLPYPVSPLPEARRVFYHGTTSHWAEIRWLRDVIGEVMQRDERITFEIVGDHDVYSLYKGLPRVTVMHPMRWQAYRGFLATGGRHVGLAPQFQTPFNRARSYTKFFDIAAAGAVGVYTSGSSCAEVVRHGVDGWVADLEPDKWVEAILSLTSDDGRREQMLANAQAAVRSLAAKASEQDG